MASSFSFLCTTKRLQRLDDGISDDPINDDDATYAFVGPNRLSRTPILSEKDTDLEYTTTYKDFFAKRVKNIMYMAWPTTIPVNRTNLVSISQSKYTLIPIRECRSRCHAQTWSTFYVGGATNFSLQYLQRRLDRPGAKRKVQKESQFGPLACG